MKKKLLSLILALVMVVGMIPAAMAAEGNVLLIAPAPSAPTYELDTVRTGNMGGLEDGIYDHPEYFDEDGVMGVVAAGNFYVNDFKLPATLEELAALEGGFVINSGTSTLTVEDGVIKVDGKDKGYTFESAVQALVNDNLPGGLHFDLYDNDGDTKTDVVKMWYTEGVIVNSIETDADGNYMISRGNLTRVPTYAGRLYDADNFSGEGYTILKDNFDEAINEGDCAIFYETPNGWVMERATEINGIFEDGKDHGYYQINGVKYPDTMKYSRDNLIVAQRNGEYTNAHLYFGFNGNDDGLTTSLWLDPKSGSPIGLSANESAKAFLTAALATAKFKYEGTKLADDATETQKIAYAALGEAVKLAEETLADEVSLNSEYDFYTYYLYLNLAGTGNDIGAAFAGFFGVNGWGFKNPYPGFDALFGTAYGIPVASIDTVRTGNMGPLGDGIYNHPEYFDEDGVMGVVADGGFYINDFQLPASVEELAALGEEGFVVNQGTTTLAVIDGVITLDGKDTFETYEEAVKAFVNDELPGGLHFDLYDTVGDGVTDTVKMWYTEGVLVNGIEVTDNEDFIVHRGDLTYVPSNAGRLYDADNFSGEGYTILENNFDESIEEGDVAIFYYTPDGWIMERATEANGMFMGGEDHHFYNIDGVEYGDTMKYSRDNLIVAQRNGEYTNAHKYFGFVNNAEGLKTSLWMDPKSASPIGLSANENAGAFLTKAVAQAKAKLAAVTLADDATAEQKFAYESLEEAIELAEKTLADENCLNSEYDFYTYYLYLSLAGTGNDIGAAFSGFYSGKEAGFNWGFKNAYPGFDALFAEAEEEAPAAETYTVVAGDCLWNIARKYYGTGTLFGKIAEANGIASPYTIYVGQVLTIPEK